MDGGWGRSEAPFGRFAQSRPRLLPGEMKGPAGLSTGAGGPEGGAAMGNGVESNEGVDNGCTRWTGGAEPSSVWYKGSSRSHRASAAGDRGARACAGRVARAAHVRGAVRKGSKENRDTSDSCPTLCCLVLTDKQQDRRKWLWTPWSANSYSAGLICCHQTPVIHPPPPFRADLGWGWDNNT